MTATTSPISIAQVAAAPVHGTGSQPAVGDILQCDLDHQHEQWLREQYQRDLEAIDRWEQQALEEAGRCDG